MKMTFDKSNVILIKSYIGTNLNLLYNFYNVTFHETGCLP